MVRTAAWGLVFAAMLLAAPAGAQDASSEPENGRYTFHRVPDGYLRLDSRSGQVSLCGRRTVGWACEAIPDERTALENEIGRLQAQNALLKKELLAQGLKLPGSIKADPPPPARTEKNELTLQLPSNAEIDRVMAMVERVWRRLVEMISNLQKDAQKKT
jgi:hypothetical protein